ncbi:unnamed protein product [Symbiodinium sp. CCMP2592]|nr:unnamed protein product [Symbiodinium sp. CCMP2592]
MAVRNRYRDWTNPIEEARTADHNFENSIALRELFSKMVSALGAAVMRLQNPGKVVLDMTALGLRHAGYGAKEEYLKAFGQALLLAFRGQCLLTPEADQAWIMVFDFVSSAVARGMREAGELQAKALVPPPSLPDGSKPRQSGGKGVQASIQVVGDSNFAARRQGLTESLGDVLLRPSVAVDALAEAQQPGMVPSSRTISTVQQSWMVVKADGSRNESRAAMFFFGQELGVANIGEIMYKHLFKIAPVTKSLFPVSVRNRYRDWSCSHEEVEDGFENSPALRNLFAKVVEAVGSAVAGLHNISRLVAELNALGMRHINYNMKEEFFEYGGQALVLTLQDGLGTSLTEDVKQAWVAVYEFISACIISGLRFAEEKESLVRTLQYVPSRGAPPTATDGCSPQSLSSYVSQNVSVSTRCADDTPPYPGAKGSSARTEGEREREPLCVCVCVCGPLLPRGTVFCSTLDSRAELMEIAGGRGSHFTASANEAP